MDNPVVKLATDVYNNTVGKWGAVASKKGGKDGEKALDQKIAALDEKDRNTLKEALSVAKFVLNNVQQSKDNYYKKLQGFSNWYEQRVKKEIFGGENNGRGLSDEELYETGIANYLNQGHKYELEVISTMLNDPDIKALPKEALYKLGAEAGLSNKQVDLLRETSFNSALQTVLQKAKQGAVSTEKDTQSQGVPYANISGEERWRDVDWDAANAGRKFAQLGLDLLQRGDNITKFLKQQVQGQNTTAYVPPEDFEGKIFISKSDPNVVVDGRGMSLSVGKEGATNLAQAVREYNSIKETYDKMNNVVNTMDNPQSELNFLKGYIEVGRKVLTQDEQNAIENRIAQLNTTVARYSTEGVADTVKKITQGGNK